jgi:hypothetical protein
MARSVGPAGGAATCETRRCRGAATTALSRVQRPASRTAPPPSGSSERPRPPRERLPPASTIVLLDEPVGARSRACPSCPPQVDAREAHRHGLGHHGPPARGRFVPQREPPGRRSHRLPPLADAVAASTGPRRTVDGRQDRVEDRSGRAGTPWRGAPPQYPRSGPLQRYSAPAGRPEHGHATRARTMSGPALGYGRQRRTSMVHGGRRGDSLPPALRARYVKIRCPLKPRGWPCKAGPRRASRIASRQRGPMTPRRAVKKQRVNIKRKKKKD